MESFFSLDIEVLEESYREVADSYPFQINEARLMVIDYLERYDHKRLDVFLGRPYLRIDHSQRLSIGLELLSALRLIADMLKTRDLGGSATTPMMIDIFARLYLQLPFAVVENGNPQ